MRRHKRFNSILTNIYKIYGYLVKTLGTNHIIDIIDFIYV